MATYQTERVLTVKHWNESLFSFTTTRNQSLRFRNGHFLMIGLELDGKPLARAYSVVSPNYAEHLEFFSIKVPNGPLTSRLQHIQVGDSILVSEKSVGTLVIDDLNPGKHLYLFSTGTGLAPFLSIIRDPDTYEKFEKVVLIHGVRLVSELAYGDYIKDELTQDEYIGEIIREKLKSNNVGLDYVVDAKEQTTMVTVSIDSNGVPSYSFYVNGTADWGWTPQELPTDADLENLHATAIQFGCSRQLKIDNPCEGRMLFETLFLVRCAQECCANLVGHYSSAPCGQQFG